MQSPSGAVYGGHNNRYTYLLTYWPT